MKTFFNWIIKLFRKKTIPSNSEGENTRKLFLPNALQSVSTCKIVFNPEFPDIIESNVIYIECDHEKNDFWYAKLLCPCGCGETITLNLIDDVEPCWKVEFDSLLFSIYPSIWRTTNCKSHFWIKKNRVVWAKD